MANSLLLSIAALLLFAALWIVGCPDWLEGLGVRCDLVIGIGYFIVAPALALAALVLAIRDVVRRSMRWQGTVAFVLSLGYLTWLWHNPPR
jgi:hypothetical protein